MRGDAVQVRVRVADGSVDESRSLANWLRDEPAVRRYGQPETPPDEDATDGQMGTGLDVLTLVLGTGLSATQLVASIIMWRASHGHPIRVIIERDDREIPVDADDPAEAGPIAEKITAPEPG
jgi:Effector Associated Constant Component 1